MNVHIDLTLTGMNCRFTGLTNSITKEIDLVFHYKDILMDAFFYGRLEKAPVGRI